MANLLSNPGFETAGGGGADVFASWGETLTDGTIEQTTTAGEFRSESAACKITAGPSADARVGAGFNVTPGDVYTLIFWTRGDGTNAGRYRIRDATNAADIVATTTTGVSGTQYLSKQIVFTAPALCVNAEVYFWCPSTDGGIAYFDDIEVSAFVTGPPKPARTGRGLGRSWNSW